MPCRVLRQALLRKLGDLPDTIAAGLSNPPGSTGESELAPVTVLSPLPHIHLCSGLAGPCDPITQRVSLWGKPGCSVPLLLQRPFLLPSCKGTLPGSPPPGGPPRLPPLLSLLAAASLYLALPRSPAFLPACELLQLGDPVCLTFALSSKQERNLCCVSKLDPLTWFKAEPGTWRRSLFFTERHGTGQKWSGQTCCVNLALRPQRPSCAFSSSLGWPRGGQWEVIGGVIGRPCRTRCP